jgi:hypothetical protein
VHLSSRWAYLPLRHISHLIAGNWHVVASSFGCRLFSLDKDAVEEVSNVGLAVVVLGDVGQAGDVDVKDEVVGRVEGVLWPGDALHVLAGVEVGVAAVHEGHPHLAHEVGQRLEGLGLALERVGGVAEAVGVVKDEGDLLEVGGAVDGGDAVDVDVPQVRIDGQAGAGVRLGEVASSSVLLVVTGKGGDALVLQTVGVGSGSVGVRGRDTDGEVIGVKLGDLGHLVGAQAQAGKVGLELLGGVDASLGVGSTLVKVVTQEQRNVGELALVQENGALASHEVTVNDGAEGRGSDAGRDGTVEDTVQNLPVKTAQTLEGICGIRASSLGDEGVKVRLPSGSIGVLCNGATTLEDGAAEERTVVAIVGNKLHTERTSTGRLTPDGDVLLGTAKLLDVILNPLQSHTLVTESNVTGSSILHLLAEEKSPVGDTVVDGCSDDRLALLDGLLNDPGQVVSRVTRATHHVALKIMLVI